MDPPPDLPPPEPGDPDCTVIEARLHEPGFYETATRIFFVSRRRDVYLLQAPGATLTLQAVDDLPPGATAVARSGVDDPRRELADLVDRHSSPTGLVERTCS